MSTQKNVEGYIAHYGLTEWWLATFSEEEREYISDRYTPMGGPPNTLTQGKIRSSSLPLTSFLNGLSTWFRSKKDLDIAKRIHAKINELGTSSSIDKPGYLRGRHFTTYVFDVKELKKAEKPIEAEQLLLELVEATEEENRVDKLGVAPWYYEELAKLYRKNKEYAKEVSILERYSAQRHAKGVKPKKLIERLEKAKELLASKGG
jgi:hypothetical protein